MIIMDRGLTFQIEFNPSDIEFYNKVRNTNLTGSGFFEIDKISGEVIDFSLCSYAGTEKEIEDFVEYVKPLYYKKFRV